MSVWAIILGFLLLAWQWAEIYEGLMAPDPTPAQRFQSEYEFWKRPLPELPMPKQKDVPSALNEMLTERGQKNIASAYYDFWQDDADAEQFEQAIDDLLIKDSHRIWGLRKRPIDVGHWRAHAGCAHTLQSEWINAVPMTTFDSGSTENERRLKATKENIDRIAKATLGWGE